METQKIVLVIAGFVMGMLCTGLSAQPAEDTITPNQPSASESTDERTDNSDGEAVPEDADEVEPASGPGLFEVDEEAATRALERSLVQSNALLLAPGRGEVSIDFSYSFDLVTQPVFVDLVSLSILIQDHQTTEFHSVVRPTSYRSGFRSPSARTHLFSHWGLATQAVSR